MPQALAVWRKRHTSSKNEVTALVRVWRSRGPRHTSQHRNPKGLPPSYQTSYIYIYIYIYRERERYLHTYIYIYIYRERERYTYIHTRIYIYIYTHTHITCTGPALTPSSSMSKVTMSPAIGRPSAQSSARGGVVRVVYKRNLFGEKRIVLKNRPPLYTTVRGTARFAS